MSKKPLVLDSGKISQAETASIDASTIGYDTDKTYPENTLPAKIPSLMTVEELKEGTSETARSVNAKLLKDLQPEFATVAEAQAQLATGKSIDPKTLGQITGTSNRRGLLMICEPADVYGNVVNSKAASPYAISRSFQLYSSFNETGYQKLPGGLYIQWIRGSAMTTKGVVQRLSFPINFPTAVLNITCSHQIKKFNTNSTQWLQIGEYTTSYCEVYLQSTQAVEEETFPMVLAIGY